MDKKTVLVVEDEVALSRVLSIKLASEGFHVLSAHDGEAGLTMALGRKPDLIILDIQMPVIDGIAMLKRLRADRWGKDAKVIVWTNLDHDSDKLAEAVEHNVAEYLTKTDWSLDKIADKVKEKLS